MTAIMLKEKRIDEKREDFSSVSTTFINREGKKFPSSSSKIYSRIPSLAKTPAKTFEYDSKNYSLVSLPLIEEQSEESRSDNIAVCSLNRSQFHKNEIDDDLETDEIEPFWRGVFALPSSEEVLFSQTIEVKVDELPSWEPYITIDSYRLEDDDE